VNRGAEFSLYASSGSGGDQWNPSDKNAATSYAFTPPAGFGQLVMFSASVQTANAILAIGLSPRGAAPVRKIAGPVCSPLARYRMAPPNCSLQTC